MSQKLVILTGMSGNGKSTIAKQIESRITPLVHISFGDIIYQVLSQEGIKASRTEIRTRPDKFIPFSSIQTASEILLTRSTEIRQTSNVIIESHAVVKDYYGFWVFPEISNFEVAKVDAIIVIHAPFELVEQRLKKEPAGRKLLSKPKFEKYETLQDSVAINFGIKAGCSVHIVETDNDLDKTIEVLLHIFKQIGMSFELKQV